MKLSRTLRSFWQPRSTWMWHIVWPIVLFPSMITAAVFLRLWLTTWLAASEE